MCAVLIMYVNACTLHLLCGGGGGDYCSTFICSVCIGNTLWRRHNTLNHQCKVVWKSKMYGNSLFVAYFLYDMCVYGMCSMGRGGVFQLFLSSTTLSSAMPYVWRVCVFHEYVEGNQKISGIQQFRTMRGNYGFALGEYRDYCTRRRWE